jgi:radical SAM superfamily enzyme YgiQ (UPF0313 family)
MGLSPLKIVLISTYELGRQPFGLASPAALLRREGHEVVLADLSREALPVEAIQVAELVGFHLPMHTATRLAAPVIGRVRELNPNARICAFGLYAALNAGYLRELGVGAAIGGEFENALLDLARGAQPATGAFVSLDRVAFAPPSREDLPPLDRYAALRTQHGRKVVGYTEASRGCKHKCRHCPVVPVYNGRFRIVAEDVVLADIRQQVTAGARHITFGDPDFFNGPLHAMRIAEALHENFPHVTYDVTIKIEHLLRHADLLPRLRDTGCLFVTSAVECVDDRVLRLLDKGHTRQDFIEVVRLFRRHGLTLSPTFIPFTPWTTWEGYRELLRLLVDLELVDHVAPIQLALRLLVTAGSRLLELDEIRAVVGPFDSRSLTWRWNHPDPSLDRLSLDLLHLVDTSQKEGLDRRAIFARIWRLAHGAAEPLPEQLHLLPRAAIPYLDEPWYC